MSQSILTGDARDVLPTLEGGAAHTCVTSPPYWGLRDYGEDAQIGLEKTPEEYVAELVAVFREVRRVLRDDGTLWLNLGDSYANTGKSGGGAQGDRWRQMGGRTDDCAGTFAYAPPGLKPKDLVGIPWRVAFALQADGWYLRSDIIWSKPNPMPESVRDRPTKAHEYLFLLSKSQRYYYDADAVKEPSVSKPQNRYADTSANKYAVSTGPGQPPHTRLHAANRNGSDAVCGRLPDRNCRSVWTIATQPFPGAHFAVMPPDLVDPCILAGCPKGGLVLDPFAGAGTVGVVARKLERRFVGIELSPKYARLARGRLGEDLAQDPAHEEDLPLFAHTR